MTSEFESFLPRLRANMGWSIALAVLLILAGLFALFVPVISGLAVTLIIGWFLLVAGILHFLLAWKLHTASGVIWEILLAIVYVFTGVYCIMHPLAGLASLTLFLAAYFLVKGILQVIYYFQLRPRHGAGWLLFDGIVSIILAVMIWRSWPVSSVWAIGTLVGIGLLFTGISRLMVTMTARRLLTA